MSLLQFVAFLGLTLWICPLLRAEVNDKTIILGPEQAASYFVIETFNVRGGDNPDVRVESKDDRYTYETPLFRIDAKVRCLQENVTRNWQVGFVQTLNQSTIEHTYETGMNSWRMPKLPINDSRGTWFPWYGGAKGFAYGYGIAILSYDDNFKASVGRFLTRNGGRINKRSRLTGIHRIQSFRVYLMAYDETHNTLYALDELQWKAEYKIAINPNAKPGKQAKLQIGDISWEMHDKVGPIDKAAMMAPSANQAQVFIEDRTPQNSR